MPSSHALPLRAFEAKRLRDDGNGKCTGFACNLRNFWRKSAPRSATKTTRQKHHVCTGNGVTNIVRVFFCSTSTNFWIHSGTKSSSDGFPDRHLHWCWVGMQGLGIRVYRNKINRAKLHGDHATQR